MEYWSMLCVDHRYQIIPGRSHNKINTLVTPWLCPVGLEKKARLKEYINNVNL